MAFSSAAVAQTIDLPEVVVTSPNPIQTAPNSDETGYPGATSQSVAAASSFTSVSVMTSQQGLTRGAASLGDALSIRERE